MSKKVKVIIVSIVALILISVGAIYLVKTLTEKKASGVMQKFYGEVSKITDDYVELSEVDTDKKIKIPYRNNINEGDVIVVYYDKGEETRKIIVPSNVDVLISNGDVIKIDKKTTDTTSSDTTQVATNVTSETTKTTVRSMTTMPPSTYNRQIEQDFESLYNDIEKNGVTEKAKEVFIKFVDFIFYDKPLIGNHTFKELTAETKAKVIYYALLIDGKIDNKFPQYKEKINAKYKDIKVRLIADYMECVTALCDKEKETCTTVKNDFKVLKEKLTITWGNVKDAFKYAYNKGTSAIKSWYEVFSGKA